MITVEFHKDFCFVRYGEEFSVAPKTLGEVIQKIAIEHGQLKRAVESYKTRLDQTEKLLREICPHEGEHEKNICLDCGGEV